MIRKFLTRILGSPTERALKDMQARVEAIDGLEQKMKALTCVVG